MYKPIQLLGCLALLAAPLFAMPAHAETSVPQGGNWRAQHEDMEGVRTEREELQGERDRLKEQCMDARGQDRTACEGRMKNLREREIALHDRMQGVHEKREVMHEERHEKKWKEHKADMKKGKMPHHHGKKAPAPKAPPADEGSTGE